MDDQVVDIGRTFGLAEEDRSLGHPAHDDPVTHGGIGDVPGEVTDRVAGVARIGRRHVNRPEHVGQTWGSQLHG